MEQYPLADILRCVLLASHVFLENGAETYRAEEGAIRICKRFGAENPQIIALTTGTFATLHRPGEPPVTSVRRVSRRSINLSAIDSANGIYRKIETGELTLTQAMEGFTALLTPESPPHFLLMWRLFRLCRAWVYTAQCSLW